MADIVIQNVRSNIPNLNIFASAGRSLSHTGLIANAHYHDELELLLVYQGPLEISSGGRDYHADTGDIVYIASGEPHSTYTSRVGTHYGLLQFKDGDFLHSPETRKIIKYSLKFHHLTEDPVKIFKSERLFEEFSLIISEQAEGAPAFNTMIRSAILRIIAILEREGALSLDDEIYRTAAGQKILPALAYINENYKEDIALSDIAALLGFNESYFCRMFKQATGATFTEYLNFVRICKAEKLLTEGTSSILDISSEVGFASVSYFNRIFRKYRSCSPSYYRALKYCRNI